MQSFSNTLAINQALPILKPQTNKHQNSLTLSLSDQLDLLIIKGDLSGKGYEKKFNKLLFNLENNKENIDHLNVFINIQNFDNSGLINIFLLVQKTNLLTEAGVDVAVYWNTKNKIELMTVAKDFEKILTGQFFFSNI